MGRWKGTSSCALYTCRLRCAHHTGKLCICAQVLITDDTSYAISLMLTHMRYAVAPNKIQQMMNIKTEVEIQGMKRAYIRDGVAFVKFLAWMDEKMSQGFQITEWEAAFRLTEWRRKQKNYMGLAYENISATGPNACAYFLSSLFVMVLWRCV